MRGGEGGVRLGTLSVVRRRLFALSVKKKKKKRKNAPHLITNREMSILLCAAIKDALFLQRWLRCHDATFIPSSNIVFDLFSFQIFT